MSIFHSEVLLRVGWEEKCIQGQKGDLHENVRVVVHHNSNVVQNQGSENLIRNRISPTQF